MARGYGARILFWLILLWLSRAEPLFAHGDHGDAAPPEGGISLVAFDGFQVELLTSPRPPRVGEESKIIIKILRSGSLEPVRNGKVLIGVSPVRLLDHSGPQHNPLTHAADGTDSSSLYPAPEMVWAGSYTLVRQLDQRGPHRVRVALAEVDGRSFHPPALFEFYLNVAPASGLTPQLVFLLLTALAIGGVGIYWAAVRSNSPLDLTMPLNLLDVSWLDRFVRWKGFQPALQIPLLGLTLLITLLGLFDVQDGAKNLATKLTWVIWWPAIIFTFILVGRLWCVMCPFGTLNEWSARLFKPGRMFPKFLRNLWLATLFFVLLTWADEQLGIIRSPQMTAWLILLLAIVAVGTGILFQRRSFCRYLCPITGLQGLYSMVSPVELRMGDRSRCLKDCRQDCYRGNEKGEGCPMFEFPMTMERNTYCNFCFECVKSCPSSNLALRFRPLGKDLWAASKHWLDESYLAVVLVGLTTLVTAQMLASWSQWISTLSRLIPVSVRILMKPATYLSLTESALFFLGSLLIFPLIVILAAWLADRMAGENGKGVKRVFVTLGYMFIPVGLAMHLAHNLSHLLSEGPGAVPALRRAIILYTPFDAGNADWRVVPLVSSEVVYWLQMLLILAGMIFSIAVGYRLARPLFDRGEATGKALVPFIVLSLIATLINLYLLNQPMGMRHGI